MLLYQLELLYSLPKKIGAGSPGTLIFITFFIIDSRKQRIDQNDVEFDFSHSFFFILVILHFL